MLWAEKPLNPCRKCFYLTEVEAECVDADTYFPEFDKTEWKREVLAEHNENGINYKHILYTKSC